MGLTVLIVENEAVTAAHVASRVQSYGYRVIATVATGEEAIQLGRRESPNLILLDVILAGSLDGIETAKRLQSICDAPVVFLTARSDKETLKRASCLGPFGYVLKPFDERDLLTQIQIALYKHQADKALRRAELERKQTEELLFEKEERLRLAMQIAGLGAWESDLIGGTNYWDERIPVMLGVAQADAAVAADRWCESIHPEDRDRVVQQFKTACAEQETFDTEFRNYHTDGSVRWFAIRGEVVLNGEKKRMVGIVQDITERKEHVEELHRWKDELESRVGARTQELVASQAQLRALATELNLAEQRERKRLATELHDHLAQLLVLSRLKLGQAKRVSGDGQQCADLIAQTEDVVNTSLTYTRTLVADLCPPVLHDFGLLAALKWLAEQLQRQDVRVALEICQTDHLQLPENQAMLLFQSVRELLMNVAKYAGTGAAHVKLYEADGYLHIFVRDEGVGFNVESVQAHYETSTTSSKFGLFSIRERMKALGGSLTLQSSPGHGTTAALTLPLTVYVGSMPSADALLASETTMPASGLSVPPAWDSTIKSKLRVLLVDDHAMVRQGLRSLLETYPDIEVVGEASDGKQAVLSVEQLQPSVVVMDINMPNMNGIDATASIKDRFPRTVVIGLSVNADTENEKAMKSAGAAMLLTKEAAVEQLYEVIEKAVGAMETGITDTHDPSQCGSRHGPQTSLQFSDAIEG